MKTLTLNRSLLMVVGLFAASAWAQLPPITVSNQAYQSLTGYTVGVPVARGTTFGANDEGYVAITLPFTFPFLGTNYTQVFADTNGFIKLGAACASSESCLSAQSFPSTTKPDGVIAGLMRDMELKNGGEIRYKISAGEVAIEYYQVPPYGSFTTGTVSFIVRLSSGGTVQIHHGAISGTMSGSVGFENSTGTVGVNLISGCTTGCALSNWVDGRLFLIGETPEADLTVPNVTVSNLVRQGDGNVAFDLSATLRNYGRTEANGAGWVAYLSRDQALNIDGGANDDVVLTSGGPVDLPAVDGGVTADGGQAVVVVTDAVLTTTPPATGEYYVLVEVNSPRNPAIVEASYANNVGSTTTAFVQGADPLAVSISGPDAGYGGATVSLPVNYRNRGTVPAGDVPVRVVLSNDRALSTDDFTAYTTVTTLGADQTVNTPLSITLPSSTPSGEFYWGLVVNDGPNAVVEATPANNAVFSTGKVVISRADIIAEGITFIDTLTGLETDVGQLGEAFRVKVKFKNASTVPATNFKLGLVLSSDSSLSLLNDTYVCDQTVATLGANAPTTEATIDCTFPSKDRQMHDLATGAYYLYFVADSFSNVFESNEGNNTQVVGPLLLTAPGPDLAVASVTAPAAGGVGETVPVVRTLRNLGNQDAPEVRYQFYASANDIITPQDIVLPIVQGDGTTLPEGHITLARNGADTATQLVRLPATMPAGTYYIGCIIDPDGVAPNELNRDNNALASRTMVVAPSAMRIVNTALPDAMIGRPYTYRLSTVGASAAVAWSIDTSYGDAPAWLSISPTDGTLSGTPPTGTANAQVIGFTVKADDGSHLAVTRLALRILPVTTSLDIVTQSLPAVVNASSVQYLYRLGAAGGVAPYSWRVASGALPAGLTLSTDGELSGAPNHVQNGSTPITFEVIDGVGGRAQKQLALRLISAGAITFRTLSIPDAILGQEYLQDIAVANQDNSALARPLTFRVTGELPAGLTVTPQAELVTIGGKPSVAGTFSFSISVEDANGRSDSLSFTMTVHAPHYRVVAVMPDALHPGDTVSVALSVTPAATVTYRLVNGSLPEGVTLDPSGSLKGTVAEGADQIRYAFVIEAVDAAGVSGITPFSLDVEAVPRASGCSSTGGGWSPALFLGLAFAFLARRRGAGPLAAALGALLLSPLAARAQVYQVVGPTPATFQPLTANYAATSVATPINMPFTFPFYDTTVQTFALSQYGYLAFNASTSSMIDSTNEAIPESTTQSGSPVSFVAPWWDALKTSSSSTGYRYAVQGTAPNRVLVVEWGSVGANATTSRISFQAQLFETTGHIRFAYGTAFPEATVSASVGIQNAPNQGAPGLSCTSSSSCASTQYPAGQVIDFYLPPELEVQSFSGPQVGYTGVAIPLVATVKNSGGRDANNVGVRFFVSDDAVFSATQDTVIGTATVTTVPTGGTAQVSLNQPLPASLTGSSYYLFAVVDPDNQVPERSDLNNTSKPLAVAIGTPTADLVVSALSAPTMAAPGMTISLTRTVQNVGNAASAASKVTYFLSDNAAITIADRALQVGAVAALNASQSDMQMESVTLPTELAAGTWWIGACANYDAATNAFGGSEITVVNNCFTQSVGVQVSTGAVAVSTATLPQAAQYAPYGLRLEATGGSGQYTWAVSAGSLPPGLSLSDNGDLVGAPSTPGSFAFDVTATSGAVSGSKSLSLMVQPGGLPLAIVDQALAAAEFGKVLAVNLVAVGGKPPYQWEVTDPDALPEGVGLASDGLLEGRPLSAGSSTFHAQVTDADGTTATRAISLTVVNPTSLSISTSALELGYVGRDYLQGLVAVGGVAPYAWTLIRFQELPQNITDAPGPVLERTGDADPWPADFGIAIDDRTSADYLNGTPTRAGLFSLTFKVTDGNGTEDTASVLLRISYRDGLAITTTQLPDAFVGQPYQVRLTHNGGSDAVGITFAVPCIQQATRPGEFTCATTEPAESLPTGLQLNPDGTILGTASGETGVYTFLVKLSDAAGRQDVRALSLRVRPDFTQETSSSGCSALGVEPMAFLALLGLALRRRRR